MGQYPGRDATGRDGAVPGMGGDVTVSGPGWTGTGRAAPVLAAPVLAGPGRCGKPPRYGSAARLPGPAPGTRRDTTGRDGTAGRGDGKVVHRARSRRPEPAPGVSGWSNRSA